MQVDLNCDLGEGCAHDLELLPLITSANIACGGHAGDPAVMTATLAAAAGTRVRVGAHPGFFDREHFGRREIVRSPEEVFQDCIYQIGALIALARASGTTATYIKPHGALYNMACRDEAYAKPVIDAAVFFQLPILGLPGSQVQRLCARRCRFVAEGFADRRYLPDGSLVPRGTPDAFVQDPLEAAQQALRLVRELGVETICVHGDNPRAIAFVWALRSALANSGCEVQPFT
jgi:5-oxoprolinase (ATP-hydrolysing) subunit A